MSEQDFSAVLLNLDCDTIRLAHMQRQLDTAKIVFTRQSGIQGDAVPDELRSYFYDIEGHPKTTMKRGEIGCYASHLLVLNRVAAGELGAITLIMEDDLTIAPDLIEVITTVRRYAPAGWDIIRLSCPARRAYVPLERIGSTRLLVRYSKIPMSAGAYLITPTGAQKFLKYGVRGLTFDDDLRRPWFHDVKTLGVIPPPVKAGALQSTIDMIEAGRFDKGISSRMERLLRGDHFHAFKRAAYNIADLGLMNWLLCNFINMVDMVVRIFVGHSMMDDIIARVWILPKNKGQF